MDRRPAPSKQSPPAPTHVPDVPRVGDEHRLEPQMTWSDGGAPAVVIEQPVEHPPQRTASERAYDGPGLTNAIELLAMPDPNHLAIADEMIAHPSERDAILAEVRKRGDAKLVEWVLRAESDKREAQHKPIKMGKEGPQIGDTKTYPGPAFGTTEEHTNFQATEAARNARDLARDAQRHGDQPHNPVIDRLRERRGEKDPLTQDERNAGRTADEFIDQARRQLADGGTP
jgi:hypothetical protein